MASYMELANTVSKGMQSQYYQTVVDTTTILTDEQMAIMALICDKLNRQVLIEDIRDYGALVERAQFLMPGGIIRSRQILVMYAMQVWP